MDLDLAWIRLELLGGLPVLVFVPLGPFFPHPVNVLHEVGGDAVHDLGKLEPEADLQQLAVLANGVRNSRLHSEPEIRPEQEARNILSVSYTHLTLPTIYSV